MEFSSTPDAHDECAEALANLKDHIREWLTEYPTIGVTALSTILVGESIEFLIVVIGNDMAKYVVNKFLEE